MKVCGISLNDTVQLDMRVSVCEKAVCEELWFIVTYSSPPIFAAQNRYQYFNGLVYYNSIS